MNICFRCKPAQNQENKDKADGPSEKVGVSNPSLPCTSSNMEVTANVASQAEKTDLPMAVDRDSLIPAGGELIPGLVQPVPATLTNHPATSTYLNPAPAVDDNSYQANQNKEEADGPSEKVGVSNPSLPCTSFLLCYFDDNDQGFAVDIPDLPDSPPPAVERVSK